MLNFGIALVDILCFVRMTTSKPWTKDNIESKLTTKFQNYSSSGYVTSLNGFIPQSEMLALQDIYDSTNGDFWIITPNSGIP
jgi:hypothetical protein